MLSVRRADIAAADAQNRVQAAELNVSRAQVYALVRDRSLLAVKIGGRGQWRVERSKLEDYIAQLYEDAGPLSGTFVDAEESEAQ